MPGKLYQEQLGKTLALGTLEMRTGRIKGLLPSVGTRGDVRMEVGGQVWEAKHGTKRPQPGSGLWARGE